jgi:phospholipase/carboxylesterase
VQTLRRLERPSVGDAAGGLVFFHGFYGIPDDFLGLVEKLDPERRLHAFLPAAPFAIGEGRASWFRPDEEWSLRDLAPAAHWVDTLPIAHDRLVLAGWSQGAGVAYALGLDAGRPRPAGVVALGGALPADVDLAPFASSVPVAIGHGRADETVPVEGARKARDRLRELGNEPLYLETDVDHRIDQAIVPQLRAFVAGLP